jgi:hypothetical protein
MLSYHESTVASIGLLPPPPPLPSLFAWMGKGIDQGTLAELEGSVRLTSLLW